MLRRSANDVSRASLDARLGVSAILKHWDELAVFDATATAR